MEIRKNVLTISTIITFLVVGSFLIYFFSFKGELDEKTSPRLQISVGSLVDASLFEFTQDALNPINFVPEASVVSRTRQHNLESAVSVIMPPNEIGNLLLLENRNESRQLVDASSIKDAPALSFDGSKVAFAQLNLPFGTTLYSEEMSHWDIMVLDLTTGELHNLGVGFRPYFAQGSSDVLIYSTPDGVIQHSISSNVFATLIEVSIPYTTHAAYVSPDGRYLSLYNELTRRHSLFSVVGEFPYELSAVGESPITFELVALDNNFLYGVSRNEETNERTLWKMTFQEIEFKYSTNPLYIFDKYQVPFQLIP